MATPEGARRWPRILFAAVGAVLALVASAFVVHRVLAPAEVVTAAQVGYPPPETARPRVIGTLNAAPLIVDDRLRIFATTRQVSADQPLDAKTRRTPYWSYRRWPAQLTGVVASGTTVVTRWSDGQLVALDARTGRVRWRAEGPRPDQGYVGRRTGAATVYAPAGLYTAGSPDGGRFVLVAGAGGRLGVDIATGQVRWRAGAAPTCPDGTPAGVPGEGFTTAGGRLALTVDCAGTTSLRLYDVATGAPAAPWRPTGAAPALQVTPLGCVVARSDCRGLRTSSGGATRGWRVDGATPVAAPALDAPETELLGDLALTPRGPELLARSVSTGAQRWRWLGRAPARILTTQSGRVHLRTEPGEGTDTGELVTLDAASGRERSRVPLTYGRDSTSWAPGFVYAARGFVAVERLSEPVHPEADDDAYYLAAQPVILAAT
ncbi:PQQ-binding-like beta-propeller repeat protein [Plantactinospora sp. CA-290183]|uniref:outer membrane protein assembly factor BamB family protein n=1 Tax=Plantactinospora sp. CA-290183 TaxID=3240006 RepID=UPI003D8D306B